MPARRSPSSLNSVRGTVTGRSDAAAVVEAALTTFRDAYGTGPGAPVVVVMAALNEVGAVADVVASIPGLIAGEPVDRLVIDDGSTDGTADAARAAGALVCRLESNLGQGQALRAGYRLAVERGARVIATMDADGQFDAAELDRLVGPVLRGEADFVNGSRRLGRTESTGGVRNAGVVLFGLLVSALSGARITDPANGFRAFRPEVAEKVPLHQVQYQTAELLMGTLALGFRVREAPVTVLARAAGTSKKGSNLRYGYRFGRVILATWWSLRGPGRSARGRSSRRR